MITAADSEFHERDPSISTWAETMVLIFSIPEERIMGNAYVLARPNLGVVATSVIVFQGFRAQAYEIDFLDARMHLPCPESFLDMELDSGLSVQATNPPRDFRVRYQDTHGACSFDLDFRSLHQPFDTHDPHENPLVAAGQDDMGYGDAWANGHLDVIGHVTGDLELRGRRYAVDCYDGMDRSWGPREEWGGRAVSWLHIPFGEELGVHIAVTMKLEGGRIVYDQLRFGYLHEHGEVVGIVEARVTAERVNMIPVGNHVWIKDARGREFEFRGTAVAGSPYYQFIPAYVCFHTLMRYEREGRVGHAEMGDIFGMDWLGDHLSPHARQGGRSHDGPGELSVSTPNDTDTERTVAITLDRKMERRGVVVHDAPVISEVEDRLRRFLATRIDGDVVLSDLARLAGGASKEQFVFELSWSRDGEQRHDRMVLRMDPPASMVETARSREFELLRALADATLPVPEVFWATEDPADLGAPAMVCAWVPGVASPAEGAKTASGLGTTYGPRLRPILAEQFVAHIAALHAFDWSGCDLPSFDRPQAGSTQAVDWRLAATDRAWDEDAFEPHPTIMLTRQWLWEHRPVVDHVSVVHGDYRNGNFLFDEESGEMTAILDWELCYLGDRHHDLAYAMMEGWGYRDEDSGAFYCSALVTREDLIAQYESRSGLTVDRERLEYYLVLNMYWAAVALIATGPRNAQEKMTHLDVMQVFLSGLGAYNLDLLNDVVTAQES